MDGPSRPYRKETTAWWKGEDTGSPSNAEIYILPLSAFNFYPHAYETHIQAQGFSDIPAPESVRFCCMTL